MLCRTWIEEEGQFISPRPKPYRCQKMGYHKQISKLNRTSIVLYFTPAVLVFLTDYTVLISYNMNQNVLAWQKKITVAATGVLIPSASCLAFV